MDYGSLTLIFLLVAGALGLILYPFLQQQNQAGSGGQPRPDAAGQTLENYEARYQAALATIKELMFDYELGKISEPDYRVLLAKAKLEAAEIRRQLEQLSRLVAGEEAPLIDTALDQKIERLVTRLRNGRLNKNKTLLQAVNAEIESLKVAAPPADSSDFACPHCAKPVSREDAFCRRCGRPLASEATNG